MALLVVVLTTLCLANETHWARSESWYLATLYVQHFHISVIQSSKSAWFHATYIDVEPLGKSCPKDEVQIMLILVITSIIAIAGLKTLHRSDESFFFAYPRSSDIPKWESLYVCGLYLHEIGRYIVLNTSIYNCSTCADFSRESSKSQRTHRIFRSGGLLSFLLIRELILERLPRPLDASEPIEPIEPTDGEVPRVERRQCENQLPLRTSNL